MASRIYEEVPYLKRLSAAGEYRANSVEAKYPDLATLGQRFVVWTEHQYRVYENFTAFLIHFEKIREEERTLHETIFGNAPQKLKFDIDANFADLELQMSNPAKPEQVTFAKIVFEEQVLEHVKTAIQDVFKRQYDIDLPISALIVCESEGPGMTKFSNHIIIDGYCVANNMQAAEFFRLVRRELSDYAARFLDSQTNKSLQNFRITNCHKTGSERVKRCITGHAWEQTLITRVGDCEMLPEMLVAQPVIQPNLVVPNNGDLAQLENVMRDAGFLDHHRYRGYTGVVHEYNRKHASYCSLCDRIHESDNTLVVFTTLQTVGEEHRVHVHWKCRKFSVEAPADVPKSVYLDYFITNDPARYTTEVVPRNLEGRVERVAKPIMRQVFGDYKVRRAVEANLRVYETLFSSDPVVTTLQYEEPSLRPFTPARTQVIHAPMKIGKTRTLKQFIEDHFPDSLIEQTIRIVSFRHTFSGNIKEKFPDYTLYSEVTGALSQTKLIVQVESLHRLVIERGMDPPDLLVLDECEAIFEQFSSGLSKSNDNYAKFKWLLQYSKHVILMDAYITDRTYRILKLLRGLDGCVYHRNLYKNAVDDKYYFTGDVVKWHKLIEQSLIANERIVIASSSLREAKTLERYITAKFADKRVSLYSRETRASVKNTHFSNVNRYWAECDVLIYTPTITAGVSFERKHFARVFGYFTDKSCPVETCIQMIGRIRDVGTKELCIYIESSSNNFPTSIAELKSDLHHSREVLSTDYDFPGLDIAYGPQGECVIHCSDYFELHLENLSVKNRSRNNFARHMVHLVRGSGAKCIMLDDAQFYAKTGIEVLVDGQLNEELTATQAECSDAKAEMIKSECVAIATAPDLEYEEYDAISRKMQDGVGDVTDSERHEYAKFELRRFYNFHEEITPQFVERYSSRHVKRAFHNIKTANSYASLREALENVQMEERNDYHARMVAGEVEQQKDLAHNYKYNKLRIAICLLTILGRRGLNDTDFIHKNTLHQYLMGMRASFILEILKDFELPIHSLVEIEDWPFNRRLSVVNAVLKYMYLINLANTRAIPDMYQLKPCNLFCFGEEDGKKPKLPNYPPFEV